MAEQIPALPVIETDGDHSRRKSLGNRDASEQGEKVLPHYLRASTGSCHDFCKYGRKHALEEKARRPFSRRIAVKPPDNKDSEEYASETKTSGVKLKPSPSSVKPPDNKDSEEYAPETKASGVKLKPSPSSKPHRSITPEIIKREISTKSLDDLSPVLTEVPVKKKTSAAFLLTKSLDSQSSTSRGVIAKKKTSARSLSTKSLDSHSLMLREVLTKKKVPPIQEVITKSSGEVLAEKKKASLQGSKKKSVEKLRSSPNKNTNLSSKPIKRDMSLSSKKPEVLFNRASSQANSINPSSKHDISMKMKLSSPDTLRVSNGRRNNDVKVGQKTGSTKIAVKKAQSSPRASLSPKIPLYGVARELASPRASFVSKPSLVRVASLEAKKNRVSNITSPLKNRRKSKEGRVEKPKIENPDLDQPLSAIKKPGNDMVQEKTLYVINMEVDNKYLESNHLENLSAEASPPTSLSLKSPSVSSHNKEAEEEYESFLSESEDDTLSEYDEEDWEEEAETLSVEQKEKLRKARMVRSVDEDGQPVKLRFRRGRIVEIHPENGGPRRLKFRRGRVLGDNQQHKADVQRSFKSRGADDGAHDTKLDSEKVVLRHQDAHAKKDAQGLFNNVIEETASKLAETRKSKVKALVGAFETVISLQDSKPSANTASQV